MISLRAAFETDGGAERRNERRRKEEKKEEMNPMSIKLFNVWFYFKTKIIQMFIM